MRNPSEFGRAGPAKARPRRGWHSLGAFAALAMIVVACTGNEKDKKALTGPGVSGPNLAADIPFNAGNRCLASDAFLGGVTTGVSDSSKLASTKLCTSQDIKIATAIVDSISNDGINYVKFTGQNVQCNEGDIIFLQMAARVAETATSARSDVGIWIGLNGGNARTGSCNQYNMVTTGIPTGSTVGGVTNIDGDACGDMNAGDTTLVQLGKLQVLCQGATPTDTLVHIGSCLGWTQPGGNKPDNRTCPINPPGGADGFRFGTTPGTGSKCNCEGFDVPITIARFASLEVVKACSPSQINGATFDLLIDGSNANADNVGCGGTTGKQQVGAGTNAHPGAVHTFGEGDFGGGFTAADYTSSYACVNRGTTTSRGSGSSLGPNNITLQPNDDVVCTYTNVLRPQLKLVKVLNPTNDGGLFDFTIAGTLFNNSGNGYGNNGTTGFQYVSIGSVSFSEAGHQGTTLTEYGSSLECRNAANTVINSNANATGTAGSVTTVAGDRITCTFTNNHAPKLSITKTPDYPNGGAISPGGTASFTVTVSAASNGGPALNVAITDTLPAGLSWAENPDKTECAVASFSGENRLLTCSIAQLNPGGSFTVVVSATVPNDFLQIPPDPNGPTASIEIDGNLTDEPGGGKDWATAGLINCLSNPKVGCDIDLPTGTSDNSFGQGTSEDDPVPSVVTGSIPNNKSDLLRFYVANERVNVSTSPLVAHDFLYLAWERVQAPSGTTNMDFELNQSTQLSANGVTPVRTAGDILIKYDLAQGGTTPVLGFHRWVTSGTCEKSGGKAPCWGPVTSLAGNANVAAAINSGSVNDPIPPNAPRSLDPLTFGEASVDLEATGIFDPTRCMNFGRAYLKSRSSSSFTAEIKDFIAPIPVTVSNCAPRDLPNRAWVKASNFAPPGGNLGDPINDTGLIHVSDASGVTGLQLTTPTPTGQRLAQLDKTRGVPAPDHRNRNAGTGQNTETPFVAGASDGGAGHGGVTGVSLATRFRLLT